MRNPDPASLQSNYEIAERRHLQAQRMLSRFPFRISVQIGATRAHQQYESLRSAMESAGESDQPGHLEAGEEGE
jgi:hypothetical protein